MSNIDKVKAKIAALLQKTERNGASEFEASAAMVIAAKLMAEHGVTADDIKNNTEASRDFTARKFNSGVKLSIVDQYVSTAIARYTDTKVWNQREHTGFKSGTTRLGNPRPSGTSSLMFCGYSVDVELAEYIYGVCSNAVEREWKMFSSRIEAGTRKQYRTPFMVGMSVRLSDRLTEMKADAVTVSGTGLIVAKRQHVEAAAAEFLNGRPMGKGHVSKYNRFDTNAYLAGQAEADNVRFHRSVEDGPQGGVKLIA